MENELFNIVDLSQKAKKQLELFSTTEDMYTSNSPILWSINPGENIAQVYPETLQECS